MLLNMHRLCIILYLLLAAVVTSSSCSWDDPIQDERPQAWTLNGIPLYAPTFDGLVGAGLNAQLAMARENLHTPPLDDPAKYVWLGRRLAYKWWYQQARCVLTYALEQWPDHVPLWRHRGHNYIHGLVPGRSRQYESRG